MRLRHVFTALGTAVAALAIGTGVLPAATTPADAATSQVGGPITRSEVLQRAEYWTTLDASVVGYSFDYSVEGPDPQGAMYRRDCSGYAAMALHLPDAPDSRSFTTDDRFEAIPMADLKPGDLLVKPRSVDTRNGHVMIFDHWDGERPVVYEHSINHEPPVHRVVTDARFADLGNYTAYRYKLIEDDPPAATHIAGTQGPDTVAITAGTDAATLTPDAAPGAARTVVAGERIYLLSAAGTLSVRDEQAPGGWAHLLTGVTDVAASGGRVAAIQDERVLVKDWDSAAPWAAVTPSDVRARAVYVDGDRIGYIDTANTLWVSEGAVGSAFTREADAVPAAALGGDRIAVLTGAGGVDIKEGALDAPWTPLVSAGVAQLALTATSVAYVDRDGQVNLQVGDLHQPWAQVAAGQTDVHLAGSTLVVRGAGGFVRALNVPSGVWSDIGQGFTSVAAG